ncbi:MAG: hypothetical protein ACI8WB_001282, partial [Phenylobacterium sp.]
ATIQTLNSRAYGFKPSIYNSISHQMTQKYRH